MDSAIRRVIFPLLNWKVLVSTLFSLGGFNDSEGFKLITSRTPEILFYSHRQNFIFFFITAKSLPVSHQDQGLIFKMIFTRAAILLTIAVVSAAPIERRQTTPATASKIVNDMELMSTDLATWQSVINPFTGTVVVSKSRIQVIAIFSEIALGIS